MQQTITKKIYCLFIMIVLLAMLAGCGKEQNQNEEIHHEEEHDASEATIVHLDRHKVTHAGIRVESVQSKSIAIPLSLPGKVSFNERKLADITSRVAGRIEKINAYVNDDVEQGAILAQLYSQEFMTIQSEFLQAASRLKRARSSNEAERKATNSIYESVKRKLRILGLSNKEVSDIETSAEASAYFIVRAQFSGTIINSNTKVGEVVEISTELFELADLATLWVLADIYEKDLPHITKGMKSLVEISASQEPFQGVIETIYNVVDEKTRTVKARIEVQNKKAMLKPGMFCTVKVQTALGKETIKIPASALLGETEKHFVFVSVNDTTFERRDVRTGVETREFAEILDGLLEGEQVVVKGGFFLKSELAKETFGEEH